MAKKSGIKFYKTEIFILNLGPQLLFKQMLYLDTHFKSGYHGLHIVEWNQSIVHCSSTSIWQLSIKPVIAAEAKEKQKHSKKQPQKMFYPWNLNQSCKTIKLDHGTENLSIKKRIQGQILLPPDMIYKLQAADTLLPDSFKGTNYAGVRIMQRHPKLLPNICGAQKALQAIVTYKNTAVRGLGRH